MKINQAPSLLVLLENHYKLASDKRGVTLQLPITLPIESWVILYEYWQDYGLSPSDNISAVLRQSDPYITDIEEAKKLGKESKEKKRHTVEEIAQAEKHFANVLELLKTKPPPLHLFISTDVFQWLAITRTAAEHKLSLEQTVSAIIDQNDTGITEDQSKSFKQKATEGGPNAR